MGGAGSACYLAAVFVVESRHTRRLIVRIDRGEEVIGSLQKLAASERFRAAWVRGTGHLEWVDLTHWDPSREAETRPRRMEGPLLALSVEGNVSMRLGEPFVELRGAFSRESDVGLQLVGGKIATASALALELTIEIYEDARLERDEDPPTGLSLWKGERTPGAMARSAAPQPKDAGPPRATAARPAPVVREPEMPPKVPAPPRELAARPAPEVSTPMMSPAAAGSAALGWAQVAAVSEQAEKVRASEPARASRSASDGDEPVLGKGDWIEHRQFGLCRIDGEDAEGALIIKLPSGMRKHIKLDFMEVLPPRQDGERRIHPLRPRKR
jgi:predicted DNA-binding protein with PD1-like motif